MAIAKLLQKPSIIRVLGSSLRIAHPDVSGNAKTFLTAPFTAAGVTLTVADNSDISYTLSKGDYLVLGDIGTSKAEESMVNSAVTRGTSVTVANTTKFSHEINTPVTVVRERGIKIYGAATDGGVGTLITSIDAVTTPIADAVNIQWEKGFTEYTLISTDTTYAYYFVKFTDGTTDSSASDYVASTGLDNDTVERVCYGALKKCNAKLDSDPDGLITREWLIEVANDFQDEVANYEVTTPEGNKLSKDWSWEMTKDTTSLAATENENKYALSGLSFTPKYPEGKEGFINIRFGSAPLTYYGIDEYDDDFSDVVRGALTVQATAGQTSVTLGASYEFPESGTIYLGADTISYTANAEATGVLSGIPASGDGSITATHLLGATVWSGINPGTPIKYTTFEGYLLFNCPVETDVVGYKIKVRGLKKMDRLVDFSDAFEVPYTHLAKIYIASQIEYRKGNDVQGDRLMLDFKQKLNDLALKDKVQTLQPTTYYIFDTED